MCARPASQLTQDPDIFDTWFSSGLWPFSTLGWPDNTDDFRRYYPGTVMETGYDIIFFWVARMMMLGLHMTDAPPFETVYLSGLIRDPLGAKMSKTKGNTVDPLATIDESGADALRFALIHGTTPGQDQKFGPAKVENARNFANKLWNATRFVLGARPASIAEGAERRLPDAAHLGPADRWVLSRAAATTAAVDRAMAELRLRRGDPAPVRRHLERVLRLGPGAGQGAPLRRERCRTRTARPRGGRSSRRSTPTSGCSTR